MKGRSGFTLLELLVASSLFMILLGALSGTLLSTTRAYRAEDRMASLGQERESAEQQLQYEISLAGFRGTTKTDYDGTALTVGAAPFVLVPNASGGSEQITIKYFENRTYGSASKEVKTVVFSVDSQTHTLLRRQGLTAEAIASGVTKLRVVRYLPLGATGSERDCSSACAAAPPTKTVGAILELTFTDASVRRIPITFRNPVS